MSDAHSEMLELTEQLVTKRAAGHQLTLEEQTVCDIAWVDVMVAPNGFDGWLSDVSVAAMQRTLEALDRIGDTRMLQIVRRALEVSGVAPASMSDDEREARLESLSETDRERLTEIDGAFYDAIEQCMACCKAYVSAHPASFSA